ncbi:MAG TPA: hypothetical protein PK186_13465 [candidate division Zixibacteria bacterium]|nr:hypothetical protein [candidate division Zixibacteria bacterium]
MAAALGKNKPIPLWRLVTGKDRPEQAFAELYVQLKNQVFQVTFDNEGRLDSTPNIPDRLIDTYIAKEFREEGSGGTFGKAKNLGGEFINKLRTLLAKNKESEDRLTYEHVFTERIHAPSDSNVILVGDTGCGKTHKLRYIWSNYLERCKDCSLDKECPSYPNRPKFYLSIDPKQLKSRAGLFKHVFNEVVGELQQSLNGSFEERYRAFIEHLFQLERPSRQDYFTTMLRYGLEREHPKSFHQIADAVPDDSLIDLVKFVLHFCGWLREHRCKNEHLCMFIVFDNLDASPQEVQEAIVTLLLDVNQKQYPLMIAACRPETLINWRSRRSTGDVVEHIGPTAYEVVLERLRVYLEEKDKDMTLLADRLKNIQRPDVFISNLNAIYSRLKRPHFRTFFDSYFGIQIRDAVVFAQSIVDIAAQWDERYLTDQVLRSDHSLERYMLNPWGLRSNKPHIANVFGFGPKYKDRLVGIRVLQYVYQQEQYTVRVKDVCNHLSLFGHGNEDTLRALGKMLQRGLLLTVSRENYELGPFEECQGELIERTATGDGFRKNAFSLSYISTVMYSTLCRDTNYPHLRVRNVGDPRFVETLAILREFLRETWQIERVELESVLTDPTKRLQYLEIYDETTISYELYISVIPVIVEIGLFEQRKGYSTYKDVIDGAYDYMSDFNMVTNAMKSELHIGADPTEDHKYVQAVNDLEKAPKESRETIESTLKQLQGRISSQDPDLCAKWIDAHFDLLWVNKRLRLDTSTLLSGFSSQLKQWNRETNGVFALELARVASLQGEKDEAFEYLKVSIAKGIVTQDKAQEIADLESLHTDPRWETLLAAHLSARHA